MDVREKLVELLTEFYGCDPMYYDVDALAIAQHLTTHDVTVQEWISVTERLPDWRDGKVLVFTKYGFSICERTVNNRWRGQHANWITHWAYLPQPPKGE